MPRSLRTNGPLLMSGAYLGFGLMPITVKWCTNMGYSGAEVTFLRMAFACVAVLVWARIAAISLRPVNGAAVIRRGLFGGVAALLYFIGLQLTTAANGTLLYFTGQIWANAFNVLFYGIRPPRGFWPLLGAACVGVWLVLSPDFQHVNAGDLLTLLGSFGAAGAILANKEARETDHSLTIFGSFSLVGLFSSGLCLLYALLRPGEAPGIAGWNTPDASGTGALIVMAAVSMVGQLFFTYGYAYTSIALGTLFALSVPVFAAVFGHFAFGERFTAHFVVGAALILASAGLLVFFERRSSGNRLMVKAGVQD